MIRVAPVSDCVTLTRASRAAYSFSGHQPEALRHKVELRVGRRAVLHRLGGVRGIGVVVRSPDMPAPGDSIACEDRQYGIAVVDLVRYPEREAIPAELYRGFTTSRSTSATAVWHP